MQRARYRNQSKSMTRCASISIYFFTKEYEANFTEELFKIARVARGDLNVYELVDHEGEPVIGKVYEEELSADDKKDNLQGRDSP